MNRTRRPERRRRSRTGAKFLEAFLQTAFLVVVGALFFTAVMSITTMQQQGQARSNEQTGYQRLAVVLRDDLRAASTVRDPVTGRFRYESFVDVVGKRAFRFRKLGDAHVVAGEIVPEWSSWIEYHVGLGGFVTRLQDGVVTTVGSGIEDLQVRVTPMGRFQVVTTTSYVNPATGDPVENVYSELIAPLN